MEAEEKSGSAFVLVVETVGATGGFEMQSTPPPPNWGPCTLGPGVNKVNERAECIQLVKWPMSHRCVISLCQAHCRGAPGRRGGGGWLKMEVRQGRSQSADRRCWCVLSDRVHSTKFWDAHTWHRRQRSGTLFQVDMTQIQAVAQNAIQPWWTWNRKHHSAVQQQSSDRKICPGLWRGWRVGGGGVTHSHFLSSGEETGVRTASTPHTAWLILTWPSLINDFYYSQKWSISEAELTTWSNINISGRVSFNARAAPINLRRGIIHPHCYVDLLSSGPAEPRAWSSISMYVICFMTFGFIGCWLTEFCDRATVMVTVRIVTLSAFRWHLVCLCSMKYLICLVLSCAVCVCKYDLYVLVPEFVLGYVPPDEDSVYVFFLIHYARHEEAALPLHLRLLTQQAVKLLCQHMW